MDLRSSEAAPLRLRRIEPLAEGWSSLRFRGGSFDTGHRPYAASVEGTIRMPDNLVLVTLDGGAERVEIATDCGHLYAGPDRAGAVSFVPAHCERRLRMRGVAARWASIAWDPALDGTRGSAIRPFTNLEDSFVLGLAAEFRRLDAAGRLDPAYCEGMVLALSRYMVGRYGTERPQERMPLAPWRLRRLQDYIEDHLAEPILVADLAALVGLSAGHMHHAFRAATGATPLAYIRERRIRRAVELLRTETASVAEVALRVGFQSPSRLASQVRRATGHNPSRLRS